MTNSAREIVLCEVREISEDTIAVSFETAPEDGASFNIAVCGSMASVIESPVRWFKGTFTGDGTSRSFTVSHNLDCYNLIASVANSARERVLCALREVSEDVLEVTLTEAPEEGAIFYVSICASVLTA